MDDFSPAAVARRSSRSASCSRRAQQLSNLLTYMDGKTGAEELIAKVLQRPGAAEVAGRAKPSRDDAGDQKPTPRPENRPWPKTADKPKLSRRRRRRCEGDEFAALLQKEFKPKTDEAKIGGRAGRADAGRSRRWRRHNADRATTSSTSIEAIIAELDKKLTEQINLILHHEDFQKLEGAWRGLHYLVNNTETDEMLKIRVMNISKKDLGKTLKQLQGHGLGPEPALQEALRGRVRPVRRRAVRLPGRRLPLRPQPARRRAARRDGARSRPRRTRRSSPARRPTLMQMDSWQELANPRDLTKIFTHARIRRLALAARVGGRALPRPGDAALPGAPAVRRQDRARSRSSTSRKTPTAPTTASTPGPTPPTRWRPTSTARSSCTAGARASAASSPAARSKACRRTRSRPTTAAST